MSDLKLYRFRQNNSGGVFHFTDDLDVVVYVQASNEREANSRAEDLGIYFDGCRNGQDCDCCGDRWWPVDESDASSTKEEFIEKLSWDAYGMMWSEKVAILHTVDNMRHIITKTGVKSYRNNQLIEEVPFPVGLLEVKKD